ncbi:MAG: chloramphenicol acetyltransferase CAT [Clostridia bacterium]|nr:chloramphenicol acetyltransferase CAT [Clostridia bacterium]
MFHPIDVQNWPRREIFYYFSQMEPTGYSLTVDLDITELLQTIKAHKLKFFPVYLWLITRNLNRQIEFKCAVKDGTLGYFGTLTPLYATWHEDTHTFSFLWTEYNDDFFTFYNAYLHNQKTYGDHHGVLARPEPPPENAYTVSCVPWIAFKHFAVHSYGKRPYFFPSVEAGKFYAQNNRMIMPLSLTCHHATTDGYHIAEFLKDLQQDMAHFESFL